MVQWLYAAVSICRFQWLLSPESFEPLMLLRTADDILQSSLGQAFLTVVCPLIQELDRSRNGYSHLKAVDLSVDLTYSTYVGSALSNGVNQWLGIRYAAPPLGDLRFAPPQDPLVDDTVHRANKHGPLCLATEDSPDNPRTSEDCLFLDVYAPGNAKPYNSSLPVFLYIQGGGFNSNANPNLDGSGLVEASDHSIIVVTFNYRVGPYGFITGPGITANNGLRDQRKAMEWVQLHISAFGGDPDKVVLGGASAGAASIALHLTAYGGRDMKLFAAAAAESPSFATVLTVEDSLYQTQNFAKNVGCRPPSASSHDYLACLRSKTAKELQSANRNIPYPQSDSSFGTSAAPLFMWSPVIDYDMINAVTYAAFESGAFIKVPVIFGDDTDGGTIFTPRGTSTLHESDQFLVNQFPFLTDADITTINSLYPSPNCTGAGCFWHQLSKAYGELRYMCPGLYLSRTYSDAGQPSWNYRWNVADPSEIARGIGVPHTAELNAIFGPTNIRPPQSPPPSYMPGQVNAGAVSVAQAYWTSFIRSVGRDVNAYRQPKSARWEQYTDNSKSSTNQNQRAIGGQRMLFGTGGVTEMESTAATDGLADRCAFLISRGAVWRQKSRGL